jgi:ATP-dependent RNA helicase DDX52/ROK1
MLTKTNILGTRRDAATTTVDQQLTFCGSEQGKLLALRNLITSGSLPPPTLIFVQSIERANQLYRQLVMDGNVAEVGVVHSERSKSAREKTVNEFREGKVWMLVVTELMARGLDFKGVEVVVNYGESTGVIRRKSEFETHLNPPFTA